MKLKQIALVTILVFMLAPAVAWGYTFNDTTLVEPWKAGGATGAPWTDLIGPADTFDTFGANYMGGILTIFTNWNPNKDGFANAAVKTADLFIGPSPGGNFAFAIQLDTLTGTGLVYSGLTPALYQTSDDIFKGLTNLTYGGQYDQAAAKLVPVLATFPIPPLTDTSVVWTIPGGGLPNQVAIDLSGIGGLGNGFVWGTATCSNDGFAAVPLPPSVLLLGTGLLGLVGWRFRKS
jgi:PEP-CTERM motif